MPVKKAHTKIKKVVKKTAKKVVADKVSVKKKITKKSSAEITSNVKKKTLDMNHVIAHYNERFWIVNGPVLESLEELYEALSHTMLPEQYLYHAMGAQNDFAEWIESALDDSTCARKLQNAEDQYEAAMCIKRRLKDYK